MGRSMKISLHVLSIMAPVLFTVGFSFGQNAPSPNYDTSNIVTLKGTVAGFAWANPRAFIMVDLEGKNERWAVEGDSAALLTQRGWSRTTLKPGDKITVSAIPLKQNAKAPEYLATGPPS